MLRGGVQGPGVDRSALLRARRVGQRGSPRCPARPRHAGCLRLRSRGGRGRTIRLRPARARGETAGAAAAGEGGGFVPAPPGSRCRWTVGDLRRHHERRTLRPWGGRRVTMRGAASGRPPGRRAGARGPRRRPEPRARRALGPSARAPSEARRQGGRGRRADARGPHSRQRRHQASPGLRTPSSSCTYRPVMIRLEVIVAQR